MARLAELQANGFQPHSQGTPGAASGHCNYMRQAGWLRCVWDGVERFFFATAEWAGAEDAYLAADLPEGQHGGG